MSAPLQEALRERAEALRSAVQQTDAIFLKGDGGVADDDAPVLLTVADATTTADALDRAAEVVAAAQEAWQLHYDGDDTGAPKVLAAALRTTEDES